MRGFSKAIIAGNLTRDPEIRSTASGRKVASFSVAVNRVFKDANGENQERVSYINCSAWGRLADVIEQYAKKGNGVIVSGRLDQRSWDDKETGKKRSAVEIVVEDFVFAGSGDNGGNAGNGGSRSNTSSASNTQDVIPDDIPEGDEINLDDVPF